MKISVPFPQLSHWKYLIKRWTSCRCMKISKCLHNLDWDTTIIHSSGELSSCVWRYKCVPTAGTLKIFEPKVDFFISHFKRMLCGHFLIIGLNAKPVRIHCHTHQGHHSCNPFCLSVDSLHMAKLVSGHISAKWRWILLKFRLSESLLKVVKLVDRLAEYFPPK